MQAKDNQSYYDNTMLSGYKNCPRFYQLRHVLGWRSKGTAIPLVFGLSWHDGQDIVWKHARELDQKTLELAAHAKFCETWAANGLNPDPGIEDLEWMGQRHPGTAHDMFHCYIKARWKMLQEAELLACEQPFAVPLAGTTNTWYIGRLDKVIEYTGIKIVVEHKTTTSYKKDGGFQNDFVESWFSDSQVKGYQYGGGLYYPGLTNVWIDAALVHKTVHDAFRFVPVAHQFDLLKEFLADTANWIAKIEKNLLDGYFPKNENHCFGKYGKCSFLNICRTTSDSELRKLSEPPEGYMVERWAPFELLGIDKILATNNTQGATQNDTKDPNSGNARG